MTSLRFDGGQQLAKGLNALWASVRGKVLREALRDAAEPMRESMGQLAPREPGKPDIADSMVISRITSIGDVNGGQAERKNETEEAVAVGPSRGFFYGKFLEFGTVKMSARPFMRPAFDRDAPKGLRILADSLWRALIGRGVAGSRGSSTGGGML